jgi:2-hydroxychromene-2-carboxylate isomerase
MKHVDFYFDLSSPYSYLAATQIDAVAARAGGVVRWRPMVLGAVFKTAGNDMPARVPAKAVYMLKDLERWAEEYGVPFRFTSRFPLNAMKAMRCIVAAEEKSLEGALSLALFRAVWVDDRDVTDPAVLREVLAGVGLDPDATLAATDTQPVKDRLRAYTDGALGLGAFGAPTMVVGDALFWGNDRLHFVEKALKG